MLKPSASGRSRLALNLIIVEQGQILQGLLCLHGPGHVPFKNTFLVLINYSCCNLLGLWDLVDTHYDAIISYLPLFSLRIIRSNIWDGVIFESFENDNDVSLLG